MRGISKQIPGSLFAASVLSLLFLYSCAKNAPFKTTIENCAHTDSRTIDEACAAHSFQELQDPDDQDTVYSLSFVEFDDQGQLLDRDQLSHMLSELERSNDGIIVVVYVHGWKHNADVGNRNVQEFRNLLQRIATIESLPMRDVDPRDLSRLTDTLAIELDKIRQGENDELLRQFGDPELISSIQSMRGEVESGKRKFIRSQIEFRPRKVFGIYLSWRGVSVSAPVLKEFTFWSRKAAARKIGEGRILEALLKVESIVNRKKHKSLEATFIEGNLTPRPQLVVIGHSFGAAIIYTSLSQIMVSRFLESCYPTREHKSCLARGFGDLVLLVNPAFEALQYDALHELITSGEIADFDALQLPVLIILNSEGDKATKYAFPAGRYLSRLFEVEREEEDQKTKNITSVGHYEDYHTHRLTVTETSSPKDCIEMGPDQIAYNIYMYNKWWINQENLVQFYPTDVQLSRKDSTRDRFPFLTISVNGNLIPGHNEIYDCRVLYFMHTVILQTLSRDNFEFVIRNLDRLKP